VHRLRHPKQRRRARISSCALDESQLCALVFGLLVDVLRTTSIHSSTDQITACMFALSQLAFFTPAVRDLLANGEFVRRVDPLIFTLTKDGRRTDFGVPVLWLLQHAFSMLSDMCNAGTSVLRHPILIGDGGKRASVLDLMDEKKEKQGSLALRDTSIRLAAGLDKQSISYGNMVRSRSDHGEMLMLAASSASQFNILASPKREYGMALSKTRRRRRRSK